MATTTELITDDTQTRSWSTIEKTFTDGLLTQVVTTYDTATQDNGLGVQVPTPMSDLVITENYDANGMTSRLLVDAGNHQSWSSNLTEYDSLTGDVTFKTKTYDDGRVVVETFGTGDEAGMVINRLTTDGTSNALTYETLEESVVISSRQIDANTGEATYLTQTTKVQDTGVTEVYSDARADDGTIYNKTIERTDDDTVGLEFDGSHSWTTFDTTMDEAGNVLQQDWAYDNGSTRTQTFSTLSGSSLMSSQTSTDHSTADLDGNTGDFAWSTVTTLYDAFGQANAKTVVLDNGINISKTMAQTLDDQTYASQSAITDTATDNGDGTFGEKNWSSLTDSYSAPGVRTLSEKVMDNGDTVDTVFVNGERASTTRTDVSGTKTWDTVEKTYDDTTGLLSTSTVTSDSDVITTKSYAADGSTVATVTQTDTTDLAGSTGTSDTDGVDGIHAWSTITKTLTDGVVTSQTNTFDSGRVVDIAIEYATDGTADKTVTRLQSEGANPDATDFWSEIITNYTNTAADGETASYQIESQQITTDSGKTIDKQFGDDGIIDTKSLSDAGNAYSWDTIDLTYTNGVKTSAERDFDNGDETLIRWDETGTKIDMVEYDADASPLTAFKVTSYATDGSSAVTYASAATLDAVYHDAFDILAIV